MQAFVFDPKLANETKVKVFRVLFFRKLFAILALTRSARRHRFVCYSRE
jgi:hypothetical protein